ncbi:MAG: DNA topoisomerase IV subunit A [Myxococcota bacterium]|nr:DNA topoisomerase IV subunit A [Myxococcota bacterium]
MEEQAQPPSSPPDNPPGDADPPSDDSGSVSLLKAARERYLNYALSVITSRALPDVRDGLKPVQRRILYAMYNNLRLLHTARFRKSAAVVGEVMARFHPHGDQSIYDAMVRLAQPFSLRALLVEGHGNFGSLDGDPAAAMRYTEARLQPLAAELLREIGQETVPFRSNYDGTTEEPTVLPARIPNLLVNGVTGIAVGMATNIPPHNLREVCRAAVRLIDKPTTRLSTLMNHVEGPDFPCGGEVLNSQAEIEEIYETGRGAIRLRATYSLHKEARRRFIIIDSIPYGQNKANIVQQIGDLIHEGKIPQVLDVRDESTDDIRIVLELKRGANDAIAMAFLYKHTGLRTNFNVNMTVLLPTENPEVGAPAQVGLIPILRYFTNFRFEVTRRRFEYELAKLHARIHILEGFEILFDALDEAIALIRASDGKADAAARLMARFPLDEIQTDAILELKLYRLAKLEIEVVRAELEKLRAEAARIEAILAEESELWAVVRSELLKVAKEFGDDRRTRIGGGIEEVEFDPEKYIVDKNTWVIFTRGGWVKRQKGFTDLSTIRVREGDSVEQAIRCSTRSTISVFSNYGKCYVLRAADIPQTSGYGEPLQRRFAFADGEQVVGVVSQDPRNLPEFNLLVPDTDAVGEDSIPPDAAEETTADEVDTLRNEDEVPEVSTGPVAVAVSSIGKGLILPLNAHSEVSTKNGRRYMSVRPERGEEVVRVELLEAPESRVCLASKNGRVLIFLAEELKFMRRSAKGVNALRLGKGDSILDFKVVAKSTESLEVETDGGRRVLVWERKYNLTRRGGKGYEVVKRGCLTAPERDARIIDPFQGEEPEGGLSDDEIDAELDAADEGGEG